MKRFACSDIIPGCTHVFTGLDDQSVLDQVIVHAAEDHGLVKPPLALVELVVATTHTFTPPRSRPHLRLVGAQETGQPVTADADDDAAAAADATAAAQHSTTLDDPAGAGSGGARRSAGGTVVNFSADRCARAAHHQPTGMQAPAPSAVHDTYRHEALLYSGIGEFLAGVVPFIRDGVRLGQPVLLALPAPRERAVRDALGDDADRVIFADMVELANPARIIPAVRQFVAVTGGRPIRGVGEPIWAGRRELEIVESQFHEALMDVALGPDTPLWVLCPYDVGALDRELIAEAHRSHASVVRATQPGVGSSTFGGVRHASALFGMALPEPTAPTMTVRFNAARDAEMAARVLQHADTAGLPAHRSAKLAAAVDEIASAVDPLSGGEVTVRLWQDGAALVCEIDDHGVIDNPMVGRSGLGSPGGRDHGIRLANDLCDLVQVRSSADGTAVRVYSWL